MVLTDSRRSSQVRTYSRAESVVFLKTNEPFGGLSNMAGGFPLCVNGIRILTSEALYQACRFPHRPEVQWLILGQPSPMTAKMKSKPYRHDSRPDWDQVRVKIMRWCLRVKLAQNWEAFSKLLLETGDRPIVEQSRKDDFWGARPVDEQTLVGMNVLGRLLMELREVVKAEGRKAVARIEPLGIPDFLLGGGPIEAVRAPDSEPAVLAATPTKSTVRAGGRNPAAKQVSLFEPGVVREEPPPEYGEESAEHAGAAGLKPYPAMKHSGVPWLGEVPAHWSLGRMKTLLRERNERGFPAEPLLASTQSKGVIRKTQYESRTVEALKDLHLLKLVHKGDFVISLRSFQGGIEYAHERGIISPAYTVLCPRDPAMHAYLSWLFKSLPYLGNLSTHVTGIRQGQNIDYEKLSRSRLPLPLPDESAAISCFLGAIDRRIRRYIRAKQKLIKLLEDQKQAIVHRAVTRGLDPGARLKPSGMEWLGYVPKHWEVMALRRRWVVIDCKHLTVPFVDEGAPLASVREAQSFELSFETSNRTTQEWYQKLIEGGRRPRKGDLIYCRNVSVGSAALVTTEEPFAMGQDVCLIRSSSENQRWFNYFLRSKAMSDQMASILVGSTFNRINIADIKSLIVAVPPRSEQDQIAAFLDEELEEIDATASRCRRHQTLLLEYRTRLIADVVTGKVDVREAAARLPQEAEEPEPPDEAEPLGEDGEEAAEDFDAPLLEAEA